MEKLQLKDINKPLSFKVQHEGVQFKRVDWLDKIRHLIDMDVYLASIDENLQREFVWTPEQESALLVSIAREVYIPPLTVCLEHGADSEINKYLIIDGKQRITTLLRFLDGLNGIIHDGKVHTINDMDDYLRDRILFYQLKANQAYHLNIVGRFLSDEELINWYEYVNYLGTPQDVNHIAYLRDKQDAPF